MQVAKDSRHLALQDEKKPPAAGLNVNPACPSNDNTRNLNRDFGRRLNRSGTLSYLAAWLLDCCCTVCCEAVAGTVK